MHTSTSVKRLALNEERLTYLFSAVSWSVFQFLSVCYRRGLLLSSSQLRCVHLRSQAASVKERLRLLSYFICSLFPVLSHLTAIPSAFSLLHCLPASALCCPNKVFLGLHIRVQCLYPDSSIIPTGIHFTTRSQTACPFPVPQNKIKCSQGTTLKPKRIINISIHLSEKILQREEINTSPCCLEQVMLVDSSLPAIQYC